MNKSQQDISGIEFFKYLRKRIGWHIYGNIFSNLLVGLLDGLGLIMFIPLLAIATNSNIGGESLGHLQFLVTFIEFIGLDLNLNTALGFIVFLFIFKGIFFFLHTLYVTKIRLFVMKKLRFDLISGQERTDKK